MTVVADLPVPARAFVADVLAAIGEHLGVVEAFAIGSAAAGGFDAATSDVDVVVVTDRPLGAERDALVRRLKTLQPPGRGLELVLYVEGSQPPDHDLNFSDREERPDEPRFWFVLDAVVAERSSVPLRAGRRWSDLFEPVPTVAANDALRESIAWSEAQPPDDEFARLNAIRARRALEAGEWISKTQAREEAP